MFLVNLVNILLHYRFLIYFNYGIVSDDQVGAFAICCIKILRTFLPLLLLPPPTLTRNEFNQLMFLLLQDEFFGFLGANVTVVVTSFQFQCGSIKFTT